MKEIWKTILYAPDYRISNIGNVRSKSRKVTSSVQPCGYRLKQGRRITPFNNGKGYMVAGTQVNRRKKNYYVHRLVADAFIPNPNNMPEVNHIDGNKQNNRVENLEWVTLKQNRRHAVEHGLMASGERSKQSKLTESDVIHIRQFFALNPNASKVEIARKYNVRDSTIHKIINNQRWRNVVFQ